jgi:hypothetical protein
MITKLARVISGNEMQTPLFLFRARWPINCCIRPTTKVTSQKFESSALLSACLKLGISLASGYVSEWRRHSAGLKLPGGLRNPIVAAIRFRCALNLVVPAHNLLRNRATAYNLFRNRAIDDGSQMTSPHPYEFCPARSSEDRPKSS